MTPLGKHDTTRLELMATLTRQAVEWRLEFKAKAAVDDLTLLLRPCWKEMLTRNYPDEKACALCFSHLCRTVTDYSNAILRLIEDSYESVSFGLLRSAMEAFTKCHYISKTMERRQTICHDYIVVSYQADM